MSDAALSGTSDGLNAQVRSQIAAVLSNHKLVEKAVLYGSRAMGRHREGSDIDLVLMGDLDVATLNRIATELDDLLLPWEIDLSAHTEIENPELLDHIERVGVIFYSS